MDRLTRIDLLGSVRVVVDGQEVDAGRPMQLAVLTALVLRAPQLVELSELVEALWGGEPPGSAWGIVHTYVSRLRRVLEPDRTKRAPSAALRTEGSGYLLVSDRFSCDVLAFVRFVEGARALSSAGDLESAVAAFDQALGLWRGVPLAGVPGPFADAQRARLTDLRLSGLEERAEAMLRGGRYADVVRDLTGLVDEVPTREQFCGLLMVALHRLGRRTEALALYERTRSTLVRELGIDPGPRLRTVHERIVADQQDLWIPGEARGSDSRAPAQLPHDIAGFSGRTEQLAELRLLLPAPGRDTTTEGVPIVAIDGAGGTGKTALAVHLAHEITVRFPDGQLYLDLRGFGPAGPPVSAGSALSVLLNGLVGPGRRLPTDLDEQVALYRSHMAGRRMLILLDNASSADQVRPLLPGTAGSMVIITSRARLSGLVVRDGAHRLTLRAMATAESVDLLAAGLGRSRVQAEPEAALALANLCGHLPLALRIVVERAAMRPHLTLADLVHELSDVTGRLDVLQSPEDELSAIRAVFSWSYQALDPRHAWLFRLLGLHPGGEFGLDSVVALTGAQVAEAKRLLTGLLTAHLIESTARDRYRFHDLVAIYARECAVRLESAEQRAAALDRVLEWYLRTAASANETIGRVPVGFGRRMTAFDLTPLSFEGAADAIGWCERELPTIVDCVRSASQAGHHDGAWRLAAVLGSFFQRTKHIAENIQCSRVGLAAARKCHEPFGEAWLLGNLGNAYFDLRDMENARDHHRAAAEVHSAVGDWPGLGRALMNLAVAQKNLGEFDDAVRLHTTASGIFAELEDRGGEAAALSNLGEVLVMQERHEEAAKHHLRAVELSSGSDNPRVEGYCLGNLGESYRRLGRPREAEQRYHQALAVFRRTGDRLGEALCLVALSRVLQDADDVGGVLTDAVGVLKELGDRQVAIAKSLLESVGRER